MQILGWVSNAERNTSRCHLLVHQSARVGSPSLMVTNLDASIFPIIRVPASSSSPAMSSTSGPNNETQKQKRARRKKDKADQTYPNPQTRTEQLLFDRILCDVPCSGDGTIRKNLGIWKGWNAGDGNGLHGYVLSHYRFPYRQVGLIVYVG
jgi:multisite-specific tRNA:(cytosine-C5)-methyltransferase